MRRIGVRAASQSLKSPTSDTRAACGSTTTNSNSRIARSAGGVEGEPGRRPESARTSAASTAAIPSPPSGESEIERGRVSQRQAAPAAWPPPWPRPTGRRAISSITRVSTAGSTCTGRRSSSTTRSITSSSCSDTFRLSENHLQLLASALHPHLQRRHARTSQPRHRFVFEILDVLEQEGLAVFGRQPRERPVDRVLRALARLAPEYREAFLLKHVEDLEYETMARLTGAGVSALKMRVKRAREQLQVILREAERV